LAENAGLSAIDLLVKAKAEHEKGNKYAGIDVFSGDVVDMKERGVLEPARVKKQAIKSASEAAIMLLKIDDVIAASKLEKGKCEGEEDFKTGDEF
jgi:chaperonin GroEL (HSP60 family)